MAHSLRLSAGAALVGLALLCAHVFAQEPTIADVLARAGAYVATFNDDLAGIVAEEHYVQSWRRPSVLPGSRGDVISRRELLSDLLLVKPSPSSAWLQYRDVFDIDGVPVRDRAERLTRLFHAPSASSEAQAARIQDESARHNLGDIARTFNTPVFALQFLEAEHQTRFRFTRMNERRTAPVAAASSESGAFRVSTEVWVVQFEEVGRPTIIHTRDDRDVAARGRFWIEPNTGHVLMSELNVQERQRKGTVSVSYQSEPLLGLLVPVEMHERYDEPKAKSLIEGVATYGRFRTVAERNGNERNRLVSPETRPGQTP